jgi:DNA-binding transcriptional LysR family regulator
MIKKFSSWRQLQTVLCVAEHGSYRAAASALGITSSTVARHIDLISEEVGQPIFLPLENKWVLTDVGKDLLAIAQKTEVSLGIMLQNIENTDEFMGSVKLSTLSFISNEYLSKSMDIWQRDNPNAGLALDETDDTRAVERGEADVALRLTRPDTPGISRFKVSNCHFGIFTPEGGDGTAWISYAVASAALPEMRLGMAHFKSEPVLRFGSLRAIINASLSSRLSCVVPTCLARHYPELRLLTKNDKPLIANRELWFLFYETRKNDLAINAARNWVKAVFPSASSCLCGQCSIAAH